MATNTEKPAKTVDAASPEDTFKALAAEYEFDQRLATKLVELKLQTLVDFKHAFTSESEIVLNFLSQCADVGKELIQQSRVRRARWGVCAALAARANRQIMPGSDLDELLPVEELEDLDNRFWGRYKSFFPQQRMPSDQVTSRSSCEMEKRH